MQLFGDGDEAFEALELGQDQHGARIAPLAIADKKSRSNIDRDRYRSTLQPTSLVVVVIRLLIGGGYQTTPKYDWRFAAQTASFRSSQLPREAAITTAFAGAEHRPLAPKPPSRIKLAFLSWLAIWPTITLLLVLGGPALTMLPLVLRTLLLTGVLVPLMSFVLMPRLTSAFGWWLNH